MFDILFGWRKASKCKKVINRVQCRLKLLKNKRNSIVRQLRDDVAQLIKIGHEDIALSRVEQLIKDESIAAVYELLDHFCDFILIHLPYIRRNKDCPNDINEAVSSLIFASARCGDLPELRVIRKLFGERYGQRFALSAVELSPGNLVNREIKEKLSIRSVTDDVKNRLVEEISRECCLKPEVLALEYYPEWKIQQVNENSGHQVLETDTQTYYDPTNGSEMQTSDVREIVLTERCNLLSKQDSDIFNTSTGSSSTSSAVVQKSSPNLVKCPTPEKNERVEKPKLESPYKYTISGLEQKELRNTKTSSSESLPQFYEETAVCLEDIEEFHSIENGDCRNQGQFKFKASVPTRGGEKIGISCDQSNMDHFESLSEESGWRRRRKSEKASGKRLRRSMSQEKQSLNSNECVMYYDKPSKSSCNHPRKHQKKTPGVRRKRFLYDPKGLEKLCCLDLGNDIQSCNCRYDPEKSCFNLEMDGNSLRHSSSLCSCGEKDLNNPEILAWKLKGGITTLVGFPTHGPKRGFVCHACCCHQCFWNGESDREIERSTIPQKPRRRSYDGSVSVYNVFAYPDYQPSKQNKEIGKADGSTFSSITRKEALPPYSRSETLPTERPKMASKEAMLRSNSCPVQYPNYVHPKLPDYGAMAARFLALKKEHLQNKDCSSNRQIEEHKVV